MKAVDEQVTNPVPLSYCVILSQRRRICAQVKPSRLNEILCYPQNDMVTCDVGLSSIIQHAADGVCPVTPKLFQNTKSMLPSRILRRKSRACSERVNLAHPLHDFVEFGFGHGGARLPEF